MKPYYKSWKKIANKVTLLDYVVHAALKAFFAHPTNKVSASEIFRGQVSKFFTPVSNLTKLANGRKPFGTLTNTFTYLRMQLQWSKNKFTFFEMNYEEILKEIFEGSETKFLEFRTFLLSNIKPNNENLDEFRKRYYCYVYVKSYGYEPIYQAVQVAHATMLVGSVLSEYKEILADEVILQVCEIKDDQDYMRIDESLFLNNFSVLCFYEEDKDDVIAFATHPIPSYRRGRLPEAELLSFKTCSCP